ncbi:hypothetical protein ACLM5H_03125 [Fredinandcohnia humi]
MKRRFYFLSIFLLLISILRCNNQVNLKTEEKLIIKKLTEQKGQYDAIKEITDKEEIITFFTILKNACWKKVSDKSRYPDFYINDKYAIWITSNKRIRVKIEDISKDTLLPENDSNILYEIITDEKLSEK